MANGQWSATTRERYLANGLQELKRVGAVLIAVGQLEHVPRQHLLCLDAWFLCCVWCINDHFPGRVDGSLFKLLLMKIAKLLLLERLERCT